MPMPRICLCTTPRRGCILVVILCLLSALFYLATALYVRRVAHCGVQNDAYKDDDATPVYALDGDGTRTPEPVYYTNSTNNNNDPVDVDYISSCRSPWASHKTMWVALFSSHLIMSYIALAGAVLLTLGIGARLNGFLWIFLAYAALEVLYRSVMTVMYGYFVAATPANSMTILSLIMFAAPIPLWIWSMLAVYAYTFDVTRYRLKVSRQREDEDLQRLRALRFSHSYRGRAPSRAASVQNSHARKMAEDAGYVRISISEAEREQRRNSINSAKLAAMTPAQAIHNATVVYNTILNEKNELMKGANGSHR